MRVRSVVSWILALGIATAAMPEAGAQSPAPPEVTHVRQLLALGKYAEALDAARDNLAEVRESEAEGTLAEAIALELVVQAAITANRVIEGETREAAEQALAIREAQGDADFDLSTTLLLIGLVSRVEGRPADGLDALRRSVAVREAIRGPDDMQVAVALDHLGDTLVSAGEYDEAEAALERRAEILTVRLDPGHARWIWLEDDRGMLAFRRGRYREAREIYVRVADLKREALGPEHPHYLNTLGNLAVQEMQLAEFAAARSRYEEVIAAWEHKGDTQAWGYAAAWHNLGIVLKQTGDYHGARQAYNRALDINELEVGPHSTQVASNLVTLGSLAEAEGAYTEAWSLYSRAQRIQEEALGPDHVEVGTTLDAIATLLYRIGDDEGSRRAHERALAIFESIDPDHPYVAMSLSNFALLLDYMGETDEAQRMLERSLEIRERTLGEDHLDTAMTLGNLASMFEDREEYDSALDLYRRRLEIREDTLGEDHWRVGQALDSLADVLQHGGPPEREESRALYLRSLAIQETALGPDHPYVASTLRGLARLDLREGRFDEALERALRSEEISREHLRLVARGLAERKALEYAEDRGEGVSLAVSAALASGASDHAAAAWDALTRSRSVVIDEIAIRRKMSAEASDPLVADGVADLAAARTRLANLMVRGSEDPDEQHAELLVERAREQVERLEEGLAAAGNSVLANRETEQVGYAQALVGLNEDAALVGWALVDLRRPASADALKKGEPGGDPAWRYVAFVLGADRAEPALIEIGGRDEIDELIASWRAALVNDRNEAAYRRAGENLRRRLWDPISARLTGAGRVLVVPDGAVHRVHFATLPVGRRGYLVDRGPVVHVLSTERDLAVPAIGRGGTGLFAVGGPDFDDVAPFASLRPAGEPSSPVVASAATATVATTAAVYRGTPPSCRSFGGTRFDTLPGATAEIDDVIEIWAQGGRDEPALRLHGSAASETAVKQRIAGHRVVHLATHGFVLDDRCGTAELEGLGAARTVPESPLRMSGLALAGANHRSAAAPDEDDGILTAEEIATLDLSGVEWAVLSACDTGLGPYWSSEGILGLRRSFRAAGARTLLMSLWPVSDRVARRWVAEVYRARFEDGRSTDEAVWEATRRLLDRTRRAGGDTHPARWAALVGVGDWR